MAVETELTRKWPVPLSVAFDVIAETDSYPRIFPEVAHSRARWIDDQTAKVDLMIAAGPFRERFVSRLSLRPRTSILASMESGSLKALAMEWAFRPLGADETEITARLSFSSRFRMADALIQRVVDAKLPNVADRFEREALARHAGADGKIVAG